MLTVTEATELAAAAARGIVKRPMLVEVLPSHSGTIQLSVVSRLRSQSPCVPSEIRESAVLSLKDEKRSTAEFRELCRVWWQQLVLRHRRCVYGFAVSRKRN